MKAREYIAVEVDDVPNKCEACNRFKECWKYPKLKYLCNDGSGRNIIYKWKPKEEEK